MAYQFRIAEIEQLAARLTAPLHSAWRGRPGSEARRALGKVGFWIAQPGLDAACQRQLVALQRSRREVADVATAAKRWNCRSRNWNGGPMKMAIKTTPASSSPSCVASTRTCRTARSGLPRSAGG
jgi:hypothetical protein